MKALFTKYIEIRLTPKKLLAFILLLVAAVAAFTAPWNRISQNLQLHGLVSANVRSISIVDVTVRSLYEPISSEQIVLTTDEQALVISYLRQIRLQDQPYMPAAEMGAQYHPTYHLELSNGTVLQIELCRYNNGLFYGINDVFWYVCPPLDEKSDEAVLWWQLNDLYRHLADSHVLKK